MSIVFINPYRYDPDAEDYIKRVIAADVAAGSTSGLEIGVQDAINAFVVGCKADGIWPAIKASCILAGAKTLAGALVPLVGTAPTRAGAEEGWNYSRKTGLKANGTDNYLNSNRNNSADPQNNRHISLYISSAHTLAASGSYIGAGRNNTGASNMGASAIAQNSFFSRLSCSTANSSVLSRTHTGFAGMNRSSASQYELLLSPNTTTVVQSSQTPFNGNFFIFGENNVGTLSEPANARLSFYSIGESLGLALLDARVTTLMSDLAAVIP